MAGHEIDYLVVGHITHDVGSGPTRLGGTALYAAQTALRLARRVGIVTSVTERMREALLVALPGVQLHSSPTTRPTTFENRYQGDRRAQRVLWRADGLMAEAVPDAWRRAPLVHLAPVAQEVSPSLLDVFEGRFLGLTPQGWLRSWDEAGIVRPSALPFDPSSLARATALVFSDEDVGEEGLAQPLLGWARYTVQTRASASALLHTADGTRAIPACATRVVNPTGAGDVFATAFFIRLSEGAAPEEAVRFAHAAAALAISRAGEDRIPVRDEIEAALATA